MVIIQAPKKVRMGMMVELNYDGWLYGVFLRMNTCLWLFLWCFLFLLLPMLAVIMLSNSSLLLRWQFFRDQQRWALFLLPANSCIIAWAERENQLWLWFSKVQRWGTVRGPVPGQLLTYQATASSLLTVASARWLVTMPANLNTISQPRY